MLDGKRAPPRDFGWAIYMNTFSAVLLSFFPKRYRQFFTSFEVPTPACVIGGLLQTFVSFGLLIRDYHAFMNARLAALPLETMERVAEKGGEGAIMSFGGFFMMEYLLRLTPILLLYFLIEGSVRTIAAIATRETVPSLPLKLFEYADAQLSAKSHEKSMGARIRDEVVPDPKGQSLQIASCRPKPWTQLTAISHEGQFYELVAERKATAPRPFVYILHKKPPTAVIRGICVYDPDEILQGK
jgi:hypothetical protein